MPIEWQKKVNKWSLYDGPWMGKMIFTDWKCRGRETVMHPGFKKLWVEPPGVTDARKAFCTENYFGHRVFIWMPYRFWDLELKCPTCKDAKLSSKCIYKTLRVVFDMSNWYYMGTEYLQCSNQSCNYTTQSWTEEILSQLAPHYRAEFPALLSLHYGLSMNVVELMRSQTYGNSATDRLP